MTGKGPKIDKTAADEVKARILDYVKTFTTESGRRVIKDMRKSFDAVPEDPNPFVVMRAVGRKDVLDKILALIRTGRNSKAMAELLLEPEDEGYQP